ncbi:MAG: hypothetical protein Phog2KO_05290 [Phototrophicaceae bacterium]
MQFSSFNNFLLNDLLPILIIVFIALLFTYSSRRIARRMLSVTRYSFGHSMPQARRTTLEGVFAGLIALTSLIISTFFCVAQFVEIDTLIWVVGLFSAAFGIGFRPLISDFLTGVLFVFENTLDVGEKVDILGFEGVVEEVNLRTIHVRGISGELIVIPNGEIRQFRNFSRGEFTPVNITVKILSKDISEALDILEPLGEEALHLLPNLIEKWHIISDDSMGNHAELKIIAKAKYGQGAEMRPRMQALIQERLAEGNVELAG